MTKNKLIEMANKDPSQEARPMSIRELCTAIDDGRLVVPEYQRDIVWTLPKSIDLFNYQVLGKAPVAALSMNGMSKVGDVAQYTFIDREYVCGPSKDDLSDYGIAKISSTSVDLMSIVDGQQRITTNYKAYINHPDFNNVALDLSAGKFRTVDFVDDDMIPVGIIYNKDENIFYDALSKFDRKDSALINTLRNKFFGYRYHVNFAKDMTRDEQVEWFTKLNNAGTTVSSVQLNVSKLKLKGVDVYKQFVRPFNQKLLDAGYEDIITQAKAKTSTPIACLNPMLERLSGHPHKSNYSPIPSDAKTTSLDNLTVDQILECFDVTLSTLDEVLDFYSRIGIHPTRAEPITFLLGYRIFTQREFDDADMEKWYRETNFTDTTNSDRRKIYSNLLEI